MTRTGGVANPLMTDTLGTSIGDATKGNTSAAGAQVPQLCKPGLPGQQLAWCCCHLPDTQ